MNYYEHHIGDWDQATAHLTAVEDGIYSRMVRWYMASEGPLPLDVTAIQRRVRARARDEKAAVQAVLDEFFERQDDGFHQHRCDEEIARFKDKQRKAKASADARWNKDKENSGRNANASQTDDANSMRTHSDGNALQTPDTKHQTPERESRSQATRPPSRPKSESMTLATYLANCKAAGQKPIPDGHAVRRWCADAGIVPEMVQVAWVLFRERYTEGEKGKRKRYVDWPAHFATAVKDNWAGLWFMGDDGKPAWTSKGLTHKAVLDARMGQREAAHG